MTKKAVAYLILISLTGAVFFVLFGHNPMFKPKLGVMLAAFAGVAFWAIVSNVAERQRRAPGQKRGFLLETAYIPVEWRVIALGLAIGWFFLIDALMD